MATSERIQELLQDALDCPDAESRRVFLRSVDVEADSRRVLEELLDSLEVPDDFLERSLVSNERLDRPHAPGSASAHLRNSVGPYRLRSRLAEGAMGVVYIAEGREGPVALKLIRPGLGSAEMLARFQLERQALARMDHPNIARVLDGGSAADGRPYFVMELVEGPPLTNYCDQRRLTIDERLELFIQVCDGVRHAHQKGVIHRDLKPTNILVASVDERAVPKIIDFGVAKAIEASEGDSGFTSFGRVIGTPEYMSPEQAESGSAEVDTRSDVYSLGVLLYELLTGDTPISGDLRRSLGFDERRRRLLAGDWLAPSQRLNSHDERIAACAENRSCSPTQWRQRVAGDLDWIVLRALEVDRAQRYQEPGELANDLRRFLAFEPVEARPPSVRYKLKKFVRRHRWPVALSASLLLALLVGVVGTTAGLIRAASARRGAEQAARQAQAAEKIADTRRLEAERAQRDAEQSRQAASLAAQRSTADLRTAVESMTATIEFLCDSTQFDLREHNPLRDALLQNSLELFERLESSTDAELREMVVTNYYRVAQTHLRHESSELALKLLDTAERLARQLTASSPTSYRFSNRLALVLSDKALALANVNRFDDSIATSLEVIRLWETFQKDQSDAAYGIAVESYRLANTFFLHGDTAAALEAANAGLARFHDLVEKYPGNELYRGQFGAAFRNHGMLIASISGVPESAPLFEKALSLLESLHRGDPGNRRLASDLGYTYMFWGMHLGGGVDRARGKELLLKAVPILEAIVQDRPRDIPEQLQFVRLWELLGQQALSQERFGEARGHFRQAEGVLATVARLAPETPDILLKQGQTCTQLGIIELKLANQTAAAENFQRAVDHLTLARNQRSSPAIIRELIAAYRPLAEIAFRDSRYADALAAQHEVIEFNRIDWQEKPRQAESTMHFASMINWAGRYARKCGNSQLAHQHFLRALQLLLDIPPADETPFCRVELSETYRLLTEVHFEFGQPGDAVKCSVRGLAVWADFPRVFPKENFGSFRGPAETRLARHLAAGWTWVFAEASLVAVLPGAACAGP